MFSWKYQEISVYKKNLELSNLLRRRMGYYFNFSLLLENRKTGKILPLLLKKEKKV